MLFTRYFFADNSMKEDVFTQHKDPDPENFNIGGVKTNEIEKTGLELIDTKILRLRFPDDHRQGIVYLLFEIVSNPIGR